MGEDVSRQGQLDDDAQVHDADAVADILDDAQIVGDKKVSEMLLFLQIQKQIDDLGLDGNVQRRDRLIADDELRVQSQRPGDADALPLPA